MPVSEKTYRQVALEDPEGRWELSCRRLRSKPAVTTEHSFTITTLADELRFQLGRREYVTREDGPRLRIADGFYYLPDVCVLPLAFRQARLRDHPRTLELYDQPMPFVAEVWSPATGDYDVETKIPEYQRRGDLEIWLLHPYDKTVRRWTRLADGSYEESHIRGGSVQLSALPDVTIEIESLFA